MINLELCKPVKLPKETPAPNKQNNPFKKVQLAERVEVVIYKYFNKSGDDSKAIYTTSSNEVYKNGIGGIYNQKFRNCRIDNNDKIFGRVDGVRLFVCSIHNLKCFESEMANLYR